MKTSVNLNLSLKDILRESSMVSNLAMMIWVERGKMSISRSREWRLVFGEYIYYSNCLDANSNYYLGMHYYLYK